MKTIIAGSRGIVNYTDLLIALQNIDWKITKVVSGGAKGVDQLGEQYAEEKQIPLIRFPTQWKTYGKAAGYVRNEQMAKYADTLLAVWDGKSSGTRNMIQTAEILELKVYTHIVK